MLARLRIDPYLIALAATVALASVLPATGAAAPVVSTATDLAIALLFFLYGARLSPQAILAGITHWRLQSVILVSTYLLFPLLGLALAALVGGRVSGPLATGLVFVCLLPSTVQSSIAFTSIARGNVPAALCAASVSNMLGVVLTPVLVALVLHADAGFSLKAFRDIAVQLLLPFVAGQLVRPWLGPLLARHKKAIGYVDRGSILLVVYEAFGAGVVAGIWSEIGGADLAIVIAVDVVLLAVVLVATTFAARALGFSKADEIAIVFCGSKKSMASGIPMAGILFPAATVGLVVLPLMLFHQIQLFACAFLAQRYAARPAEEAPAEVVSGG
ncbi:bile acid:sodium symporter family protein [Oharaeibacter diazotrophicus]|uniref:Sodium/bile acid cotransporter 7 n=1 Tax=Oharaeibacter diazotrophicus TaxID=1920512 RepID=A0A4R6R6H6_9HYPH|nr:bile acid:sodium symporter family protein [Oharaeibacter diazotrophicus]TDP81137.1 sodium/bile acid cotransporter 7 [Oharaeibacter diazotrophicus]BBE74870.1 sodium bile acid symporter family protein [Pleomorphomonas sp. SM30]GLS75626.1 bile acid:sodium symporter [Oharaeibacter diazotrophicus]